MPIFETAFSVPAPILAVADFHRGTEALKYLTPPPILVQLHQVEPLAEGSRSEFSLWFGPLRVRWVAIHTRVDPLHGFTDVQSSGPMAAWQHTHRFEAVDEKTTRIIERIEYAYPAGWRGLMARLLFNPLGLHLMFVYRAWSTRRRVSASLRKRVKKGLESH